MTFEIQFDGGRRYNIDDIRKRKQAFMPDGEHGWVISAVYSLDDPEQSMDSMELSSENFVGVTGISCLLCNIPYSAKIRHYKCPQKATGRDDQ